jgi:hypothetical protein
MSRRRLVIANALFQHAGELLLFCIALLQHRGKTLLLRLTLFDQRGEPLVLRVLLIKAFDRFCRSATWSVSYAVRSSQRFCHC